jgi:hypothetical protein
MLLLVANTAGSTWLIAVSWTMEVMVRRRVIAPVPHLRTRIVAGVAGIVFGIIVATVQVIA